MEDMFVEAEFHELSGLDILWRLGAVRAGGKEFHRLVVQYIQVVGGAVVGAGLFEKFGGTVGREPKQAAARRNAFTAMHGYSSGPDFSGPSAAASCSGVSTPRSTIICSILKQEHSRSSSCSSCQKAQSWQSRSRRSARSRSRLEPRRSAASFIWGK